MSVEATRPVPPPISPVRPVRSGRGTHRSSRRRRKVRAWWWLWGLGAAILGLAGIAFAVYIDACSQTVPEVSQKRTKPLTPGQTARLGFLYRQIRSASQNRALQEPNELTLTLTKTDVTLLLDAAARLHPRVWRHLNVDFWGGRFHVNYSEARRRFWTRKPLWWNWSFDLRITAAGREIGLDGERFRLGGRPVPGLWARAHLFPRIRQSLTQNPLFAAVECLWPQSQDQVRIQFRLTREVQAFFHDVLGKEIYDSWVSKADVLDCLTFLARRQALPAAERIRALFRHCSSKATQPGASATRINRAALLALALASGDLSIESRLGIVLPEARRESVLRRPLNPLPGASAKLWQAFITGAADTILDSPRRALQHRIEREKRAALGKDGWSYRRIQATLAGIALAEAATITENGAGTMLELLAKKPVSAPEFFPADADRFPEHLNSVQLDTKFGGLYDPRHCRMMADIREAVRQCRAYRGIELP